VLVFGLAPFNLLNNRLIEGLLDLAVGGACAWGAFRLAFPRERS
jgi:hypothetical protein